MKCQIVKYGHPALRTPGKQVEEITPALHQLVANMIEAMDAENGAGLAAQQVGEHLQLFVLNVPDAEDRPSRMWIAGQEVSMKDKMPMALFNTEVKLGRQKETLDEGCLSFPEMTLPVPRSKRVTVKAVTLDGSPIEFEAEGLLARAVQHELDHTRGVLFIDRTDAATRHSYKRDIEALRSRTLRALGLQT